ncbi:MAG: radical SAM family heme chaperone HemW [Nocardioides sp.]
MPPLPPAGDPAPPDGQLSSVALARAAGRPFGVYVHIPFCARRCGYCDFNTYTPAELNDPDGAMRPAYAEAVVAEVGLARRVLGQTDRPVTSVFFGGGTPTVMRTTELSGILAAISAEFGLVSGAEITIEANPDSVALWDLEELRGAGFNRISFGMQSAVDRVLATLDRTHDPLRVPAAVNWARQAGFEQVSLDLIYGTPGESLADWETTVEAALACGPDHISAYALTVERGTALFRKVRSGQLPAPSDDDQADKYVLADERFAAAGLSWYELSNWARDEASRCRHNLLYWTGANWWGIGAGAHSHVGGTRWWNVRPPAAYAARLGQGVSPAEGREELDEASRRLERVLLEVRLAEGLSAAAVDDAGLAAVPALLERGLITTADERIFLTRRGRLLADGVVRELVP